MGVHQREGAIGAVGALGCLIPCVYRLSGVFSGALVDWQGAREERLSGACFYGYYYG